MTSVVHDFQFYMSDEERSGRVVCFRKIVSLPFLASKGMPLTVAGVYGGGLRAGDVELNVDTGEVVVDVEWGNPSELQIYEMGHSLIAHEWEIYFEDNTQDIVSFINMERPAE